MKDQKTSKFKKLFLLHLIMLGSTALIVILLSLFLDSICPIHILTGLNCPFCGMTRAHLAALRLDFAAAFYYHPLFFAGIPYLFILIHEDHAFKSRLPWYPLARKIATIVLTVLFIGVYILRILLNGIDFL